jgi:hypothetical protein
MFLNLVNTTTIQPTKKTQDNKKIDIANIFIFCIASYFTQRTFFNYLFV